MSRTGSSCRVCDGLRYVRFEGDSNLSPCPSCFPVFLRASCNIPLDAPYRLSDLEKYPHTLDAINRASEVMTRPVPNGFFVMSGAYGVGKTHIGLAMCSVAINRCLPAAYYTAEGLLDWLKDAFGKDDLFGTRWDELTSINVLFIDEFGRFKESDWANARMMDLVGSRYVNRSRLLTIIAYNDEAKLDPYYVSRFTDKSGCNLSISGPDLRQLPLTHRGYTGSMGAR